MQFCTHLSLIKLHCYIWEVILTKIWMPSKCSAIFYVSKINNHLKTSPMPCYFHYFSRIIFLTWCFSCVDYLGLWFSELWLRALKTKEVRGDVSRAAGALPLRQPAPGTGLEDTLPLCHHPQTALSLRSIGDTWKRRQNQGSVHESMSRDNTVVLETDVLSSLWELMGGSLAENLVKAAIFH